MAPRPTARHLAAATAASLALALVTACSSSGTGTAASATAHSGSAAGQGTSGTGGFGLQPVPAVVALVPDSIKSKGSLNNAIYNDGAPEQFLADGKLIGVQPDLAEAMSEVMGVKFTLVPVGSFDSIIPGLQGGRYDVAFADFGITAVREKIVDFVEQFTLGTSFAVEKGSGKKIASAADLCGITLGALAGSYFLDQVKSLSGQCTSSGGKAITIQSYPTQADAILAVANGRTDAYATSTDQLAYAAQQPGASLDAQPFVYQPLPQGIGMPKGSPLAIPLQAALRELISDGTYAKILQKWGISAAAIPATQILINPSAVS